MQERCVIRHDVSEVRFGVYKEEEILRLSVVRVSTAATYDRLGNPLQGGLYDPAMGPLDARTVCVTCGLSMRDCPGHMGHLPLSLHVYNPLTFALVFQALRVKCFGCHGFRLATFPCHVLAAKLKLIDAGYPHEAEQLDEQLALAETNQGLVLRGVEERLRARQQERDARQPRHQQQQPWASGEVKSRRRALVKEFLHEVLGCKTCDRCGAPKSTVRKDGFTKLFLKGRRAGGRGDGGSRAPSALAKVRSGDDEGIGGGADDSDPELDEDEEEDEDDSGREAPRRAAQRGGAPGFLKEKEGDKYMAPVEVQMHMKLLWEAEPELATLIWDKAAAAVQSSSLLPAEAAMEAMADGWKTFFWRVLPISPSRFRPPSRNDDGTLAEHPQNYNVIKIMNLDERIRTLLKGEAAGDDEGAATDTLSPEALSRVLSSWIDLQNAVNGYIDSSKEANARLGGNNVTPGIRQGLEKKEGLFRMHMMGKRVNFACRSVISPDPYIGTSEIGLPLRFAKVLTYPQPVTPWNVVQLRALVEAGPDGYPGANYVEDAKGRLVDLRRMDASRRRALAARLLTPPGQKVYRHLHDGDVVLMNRQPTLHKPGIMAHHARVLQSPAQQTIRMHYANCNTYNADFDGDEMNCHFPQDELSRAEAETIACTDEQYLAPTNGKPLRGLIQDHVGSGVKLTGKNCFLTRAEFQHALFCTLSGLPGVEIVPPQGHIHMPAPAVWKPVPLWTGKQMVSAVLRHLTAGLPPLNLDFKAKTPGAAFGLDQEEHEVVIRGGELVRGVLDKAAFGASEGGLVHGVYEFYGPHYAGRLLTSLGRLFTVYLQFAGHTCGIEDLVLTEAADAKRRALVNRVARLGGVAMDCYTTGRKFTPPPAASDGGDVPVLDQASLARVQACTAELMEEDMRTGTVAQGAAIDNFMRTVLSPVSSDIIRACLPDGLAKPFPHNAFGLMVSTGAKGSTVNQSQVSCGLGQQELEGRRVPIMPSGKSLPSFPPYDPSPRAGGYIVDRFLTGVRPQEYYFHCMAGREGLIDTAVKTSRSGYLQRCLVKGLEELSVHYDYTVRDADAGVVQFLYGEDGIDALHSKYLDGQAAQMTALARNYAALLHKYKIDAGFLARTGMDMTTARAMHAQVQAGRVQVQQAGHGGGGGGGGGELTAGTLVLAKRLKRGRDVWLPGAWGEGWQPAEVVKVHAAKGTHKPATYDLRYEKDGALVKRVPLRLQQKVVEPAQRAADHEPDDEAVPVPASSSAPHVALIQWPYLPEPVLGRPKTQIGLHLGAVSERFQDAIQAYLATDPEGLFAQAGPEEKGRRAGLELLLWLKYVRSMAAPGEAVGLIAGQSIGEPSTQMTLNTFHLAGHGGANVTLGIPRLREIIMTASQNIKTPSMTVKLQPSVTRGQAQRLAARLRRLQLQELLHHAQGGITVTEKLGKPAGGGDAWQRYYKVELRLHEERMLEETFGFSYDDVFEVIGTRFVKQLLGVVTAELRKVASREELVRAMRQQRGENGGATAQQGPAKDDEAGEDEADLEDVGGQRRRGTGNKRAGGGGGGGKGSNSNSNSKRREVNVDSDGDDEDDEDDEEEDEEAQGTLTFGRKEEKGVYEADEDEDEASQAEEEGKVESEEEEDGAEEEGKQMDVDNGRPAAAAASSKKKSAKRTSGFDPATAAQQIDHPFFEDLAFHAEAGLVHITFKTRASHRRLLMVNLVEAAAERCTVRTSKGITQAFVVEGKDGKSSIQTEGCNLVELWEMGETVLQLGSITSNDIWAVHQTYGVEAARATVVAEIKGVFGAYGIAVDPRHLGLVADFMTYQGGFRALNRMGMAQVSSPFLQMSFETTATFLTEAALSAESDNLETPSAKLVMGQPTGNGTGCFGLMVPVALGAGKAKKEEGEAEDAGRTQMEE